ncbi:formylmethanofuran dehydrogenase subunit E family protein [Candidatus Bathyarchaeota archaeon]|nr:formylmethanofuran dehydrogenase subunit E family protein [Candidatus Bathyarchaeota archaeon]
MIRVEFPKQRDWSEELYQRALEFHGHGGPFMILGLRMGLLALKLLDAKGWFDIKCTIVLNWSPPDSCVIDGIQISTGCTTGKKNLEIYEDEGISAEFTKQGKHIKIELKNEILNNVKDVLANKSEGELKELMNKLKTVDLCEIFRIA